MKVVFLQDVARVGRKYDVKEVSSGYASNFLFPRKLAVVASPEMVAKVEEKRAKELDMRKMQDDLLIKSLEALKEVTVTLKEKANEEGHLYAKIRNEDVVAALKEQTGIELQPALLTNTDPLKAVGEYEMEVLVQDKKAHFKVVVEAL